VNRAVVSAGSNINPWTNMQSACEIIASQHRLIERSEFILTKPLLYSDQPDFVNCCLLIQTDLLQTDLQTWLKTVEKRLGRVRNINKNGPRTIDLDIIVWNGKIINSDYYERDFVRTATDFLMERITDIN
jgi:2-amino-4-hydroxy-6-hydroxymethyldihydropteridine diphosphokinase